MSVKQDPQSKHNHRDKAQVNENDNDDSSTSDKTFLSNIREFVGKIVQHQVFQVGMIILILINAAMMGIATFKFVKDNDQVASTFEVIDEIFLIIFTIEISLQFIYLGFGIFLDGWLFFDFFIVALSWIMGSLGNDSVKIFRSFRIFRALRLINRVKILRDLVNAIISVIPRMGAIFVLLGIVFYIFAVMFTQLFKDAWCSNNEDDHLDCNPDLEDEYFNNLYLTLLTLFQLMTMDNWVDVTRQIMIFKPWAWLPFIFFVFISGFIVVNLLIAVICDAVYELNDFADALTGQLGDSDSDKSTEEPQDKFAQRKILQDNVYELTDDVQSLISDQNKTRNALNQLSNQLSLYDSAFKKKEPTKSNVLSNGVDSQFE